MPIKKETACPGWAFLFTISTARVIGVLLTPNNNATSGPPLIMVPDNNNDTTYFSIKGEREGKLGNEIYGLKR